MKLPTDSRTRLFILLASLFAFFVVRFSIYWFLPQRPLLEALSWLLLLIPVGFGALRFFELGGVATALVIAGGNIAIRAVLGVETSLQAETIWVSWGASVLGGGALGYLARVTAILRQRNAQLLTTMREANHRIKNGLALARSVVSLEQNTVEGSDATEALERVSSRIDAIAALHDELLWKRGDSTIELRLYLRRIIEQLHEILRIEIRDILSEERSVTVDSQVAVGIGLITNELLTNIAKHDPTEEGPPRAAVTLTKHDNEVLIKVASDRGSLPEYLEERERGLGSRITDLLVEQIRGSLKVARRNPPMFELSVPVTDGGA